MTRTAKYASLALLTLSLVGCSEAAPPDPGEPVPISTSPRDEEVCEILVDGDDIFYQRRFTEIVQLNKKTLIPKVLFSETDSIPGAMVVDDTYLYFAKRGDISTFEGQILRVPRGGGEVTVLVENEDVPWDTTMAEGRIYYSARSTDGAVKWVPKSGGAPTIIAPIEYWPIEIAADEKHLYFGIGGIRTLSFDGTNEMPLTDSQPFINDMLVDKENVYWLTDDFVRKVPKAGGDVSDLASRSEGISDYTRVAQDDRYLYWTGGGIDGEPGKVSRVLKEGGAPETLYTFARVGAPCGIAVDEEYIYWGNVGSRGVFRIVKPQ